MSNAIADLWRSERGLLCLVILLCATVLAGLGTLPIDGWTDIVKYVFITYVAGKTVTGAVQVMRNGGSTDTPSNGGAS